MQKQQVKVPIDTTGTTGVLKFADVSHLILMLRSDQIKLIVQSQKTDLEEDLIREDVKELIAENETIINAGTLEFIHNPSAGLINEEYVADPAAFMEAHPEAIGEYDYFCSIKLKHLIPSLKNKPEGEALFIDLMKGVMTSQVQLAISRGRL